MALRYRTYANTPVYEWIRELDQVGLTPGVVNLESHPTDKEALEAEGWYIQHYRESGGNLLNDKTSGSDVRNSRRSNLKRSIGNGGGPVNDDLGNWFATYAEAGRFHGVRGECVSRAVRGLQATAAGRTFTFSSEDGNL